MSPINVDFHALPKEQIDLVQRWLGLRDLYLVLMYLSPEFKILQLPKGRSLSDMIEDFGTPWRICLGLQKPNMAASSAYEFMRKNPESCVLDIGELTPEGLKESQLSVSTEDSKRLKFWADLAKDIKTRTSAGLWAVNPHTHKKHFYKQKRFSEGAAEYSRSGKKLLPIAGWNYYQIEEP